MARSRSTHHGLATAEDAHSNKWLNSSVVSYTGRISEIWRHLPAFERRSLGLTQPGNDRSRLNEHLDIIVRLPFGDDLDLVPVGVVSKDYTLVPHTVVLDVVMKALGAAGIPPAAVEACLTITKHGERMALSVFLPEKYGFDPGDGHPMALRLECLNSVDGSTRFQVLMGWFRFVCSNGLVVGVTRSDLRRRHVGEPWLDDVSAVLMSGLSEFETEMANFRRWRGVSVSLDELIPWVNAELCECWGFKAATRAFHIARSGLDASITGSYKNSSPATIAVLPGKPVPGAPPQCRSLFDVSQILAWLAKERRDVQEQLEWRAQIPYLLKPLMPRPARRDEMLPGPENDSG